MAYDKEQLYKQSKEDIETHNLFWVEDVIAFLGIANSTYYEYFPVDSEESKYIKEALTKNRVNLKVKLRKKWEDSDNATLQMGLMKLISEDEERKRLSQTYQEHSGKLEVSDKQDLSKLNTKELIQLRELNAKISPS